MQSLTFISLGRTEESSAELKDALARNGRTHLLANCETFDQLVLDVKRLRPSAAIVEVGLDNSEKVFGLIKQLVTVCSETVIIIAAREASPALILGSMRSGAREFLELPINPDELRTVVDRVGEFCVNLEGSSKKNARVIAIFSGKGGAGVSFFGTNLAAAMGVPTLLVDLNLQAGDAASFFGLNPKYSLSDFVHNLTRLDDSLMSSLVTPHSPNLTVLPAPHEAHEVEDIKPQDVSEILHLLSKRYERIVLDLPHTFDPVTVAALDLADDILVLLTLDIPGIRNTKRALKVFDRLGYPRSKVHAIVNRWSKNIDVELKKVESHLGEQLIGFVPNDYKKVMDSINLGRPLVLSEPSSKIGIEVKRIAGLLGHGNHSAAIQPEKKSLRARFGRQNQPKALDLSITTETA